MDSFKWWRCLVIIGISLIGSNGWCWQDPFQFSGEENILEEDHFGIANGALTVGINYKTVFSIAGLWAPPYASSDFTFDLSIDHQKIQTTRYAWSPFEVVRCGEIEGVSITSRTILPDRQRECLVCIRLENTTDEKKSVFVQCEVIGTLDTADFWEFRRTESHSATVQEEARSGCLLSQASSAIRVCSDLEQFRCNGEAPFQLDLNAGESRSFTIAVSVGAKDALVAEPETSASGFEAKLRKAAEDYHARVDALFARLPEFESDDARLKKLYNRSLVHFLMNSWEVPEFVLHPYYSTGSVKGGCVCNYLWNFGETWEILPIFDPNAAREHICQFLHTDLSTHFAFNPIDGKAFGPWYPVNQEKIIGLIYYYVLNTGDRDFLNHKVDGKTICEWAIFHALLGDDVSKNVSLIDYGPGNHHLELRRGIPYNHVMPDLNGRRYWNYLCAYKISEWGGKPEPVLLQRAADLKTTLKKDLWDPESGWFFFRDDQGHRDLRYTIQMYKLFGSGVLDPEQESGLLSHLNENEFFSPFGFHSMSKLDPAYDQVDIDNGGGGSCTCFPPQIAERLYKAGYCQQAEDILKRILWWGEKMPYWGDSIVANEMEYRKDTPLQCTLDGVAVAQCLLFGMLGIEALPDGRIRVDPHPPAFASKIRLKGLQMLGKSFDLEIDGPKFTICVGKRFFQSTVGHPVILE
ncbi:MAG: hypothetical protein AMXMBFR75_11280 [Candidatus Hinthialibacteria bacterium]